MADNDLQVTFGAETAGAEAGIANISGRITQLRYALQGLTEPLRGVRASLGGLAEAFVAAFAVEKVADFAERFAAMGEQIERTSAILGISTNSVQEFGYIASMTGGSADAMAMAIERLQYNLQEAQVPTSRQAQALQALGLSAKQLIGVPLDEQMNRIADAVSKFGDGGNKTAIVMALMGRSGAQMIPVLDQGRAGFDALRKSAEDASVVMSPGTVASLSALDHAIVTMSASFKALGGTVVGEMAPALEGLIKIAADLFAEMTRSVQEGGLMKVALDLLAGAVEIVDVALAVAIGTLDTFWEIAKTVTFEVGQAFMDLGRVMKDVFTLNWGDASAAWKDFAAQSEARAQIMAVNMESIVKRMVGEIRTTISGASKDMANGLNKPQAPSMDTNLSEQTSELQSHYATMIKQIDDFYALQKQQLAGAVAQHRISYGQETAALLQALDARHAGEDAAYDAEIAAMRAAGKNYESVVKEKIAADDKWRQEHDKIVQETLAKEQQQWQSMLTPLESAFNSQLRGLLAGTTSWATAMKNIVGDLVIKLIEYFEKLAIEKAAAGLTSAIGGPASLLGGLTGNSGQTVALTTNTAALNGLNATLLGHGVVMGANTTATVSDTAATTANASATTAEAAASSTSGAGGILSGLTGLLSVFGFAAGTDYVASSGLAVIHQGETIIPAARGSGPFTGAGMGGQVNASTNINIAALDSRSVKRFFDDNRSHLMRAINDAVKSGAHLQLRAHGARV